MDLGSFVIGFGGLCLAGLSLLLTYKTRTALYREKLYSKQIEAYSETLRAHNELDSAIQSLFLSCEHTMINRENMPKTNKCYQTALQLSDAADRHFQNNLPFLTSQFAEKNEDYKTWTGEVFLQAIAIATNDKLPSVDYENGRKKHAELLQIARKDLGTDPLTQEMLSMLWKEKKSAE